MTRGRKKSTFITQESVPDDHFIDTFGAGVNRKIPKPKFFKQIRDNAQTFIYPTVEKLQQANLEADPDNPIYVRVAENGFLLYQITSLEAGPNDIELDNGATATSQQERIPDADEIPADGDDGNVQSGLNRRVISLPDITALSSLNTAALVEGQQFSVGEWWPGTGVGGGLFSWDPEHPKTEHNGGTVIDPDRISELDTVNKTFGTYFTPDTVSGNTGCFVCTTETVWQWGAVPNTPGADSSPAVQAFFDRSPDLRLPSTGDTQDVIYTRTVDLSRDGATVWCDVELRRFADGSEADWALEVSGDSVDWHGGRVSWNTQAEDGATGRGEAIRWTGDFGTAYEVVAADTRAGSGEANGWFINGRGCKLIDCGSDKVWFAGVRTTMREGGGLRFEDLTCSIIRFRAHDSFRGWVNNSRAFAIAIDDFQHTGGAYPGQIGETDVILLAESGQNTLCNTLIVRNTKLLNDGPPLNSNGNVALTFKAVGWKTVVLDNCRFEHSGGGVPMAIQRQYTGIYPLTSVYLSNVELVSNGSRSLWVSDLNSDVAVYSEGCTYSVAGAEAFRCVDLGNIFSFHSVNDTYDNNGDSTSLIKFNSLSSDSRKSVVVRDPVLPASGFESVFDTTGNASSIRVGQVVFDSPKDIDRFRVVGAAEVLFLSRGGSGVAQQIDISGNREFLDFRDPIDRGDGWQQGDRIYYRRPSVSGFIGQVCTAPGDAEVDASFSSFGAISL